MQLTVNGEKTEFDDGASLAKLIEHLEINNAGQGIAVAVNNAVVPREKWNETTIRSGDSVEIIRAVQGG
jgi:sulfur carrier protein